MSIPVVIATNGLGLPVRAVDGGAPVMQVSDFGIPIVLSDLGVPFVVLGGSEAPELLTAPTASPDPVTVGDNVTFTLGMWNNSTSQTGVLMQGAVDRTDEIVDQVWAPSVAGAYIWTVTASGPGGSTTAPAVSGTVEAAVEPLGPDDYWAFVEPFDAPGAVGSNLTTVGARGTGAPVFSIAATGAAPTKEANAIRFNLGQYFMADGLTIPAGDGFILAADFTPHQITGTQNVLSIITTSGVILATIRTANAAAQYNIGAGINGTAANLAAGTITAETRLPLAIELDRVAGTVRFWHYGTNTVTTQALTYSGPINAVRLSLGQSSNHSIHKATVVARPTGAAWGTTFEEVLTDYNMGGVPPVTFTAMRMEADTGQSLGLGPNEGPVASPAGPLWRNLLASTFVRQLEGTYRSDNVLVNQITAPLLKGYDETRPATGEMQAYAASNIAPGFVSVLATAREGIPANTGIAYQFHGAGGQSITALAGGIPYDNFRFWVEQVCDEYSNIPVVCPVININQGEADVPQARGWWLDRATPMIADMRAHIMANTGQVTTPQVYINQTGGYMNKTNGHQVVLDQVDLVRNLNAILVQPIYALKIDNTDDRGVHMGTVSNLELGEIQAWCKQIVEAGGSWNLFPAATATRSGDTITIAIPVRSDETLTTEPGKYADYGGDPANLGLEVDGGGSITSASVSGGNIVVNVTGAVTAVRYAMQTTGIDYRTLTDANNLGYATHRGIIRTTLTRTRTVGGITLTLKRFVPTFSVAVT